jgi:tungstate transport system substrate-binding protein
MLGKRLGVLAVCLLAWSALDGTSKPRVLTLATTTSADNSGLLRWLLPEFETRFGLQVRVIAVGTGQALKLAENGDADLVLVHDPKAEEKFLAAGYGVNRRLVMKSDFILVGPKTDPAGVKMAASLEEALVRMAKEPAAVFISRADDSGTHRKERELWSLAGVSMPAERYFRIGQGMEAALRMAHEKRAYTWSDRGTWLALRDKFPLALLFQGDPRLENPYSLIAANPGRHPEINYMDAMLLIAWLTSPAGQKKIGDFKIAGDPLFLPAAIPKDQ